MDFTRDTDDDVKNNKNNKAKKPSDFEFLDKDIGIDDNDARDLGASPSSGYVGPNLRSTIKMTPRKFANSVLEVFDKLGGASWLLMQAQTDPKAFLALLSKLIPKSVQLDDLAGFTVNVIDQFGARVEISKNDTATSPTPLEPGESGQLLIATSGSPAPMDSDSSHCSPEPNTLTNDVVIKDKF